MPLDRVDFALHQLENRRNRSMRSYRMMIPFSNNRSLTRMTILSKRLRRKTSSTLTVVFLSACCIGVVAQSGSSAHEPLPSPDPGYGLYYHDSQAAPAYAARWGYHDGWTEGRHDRNHGDVFTAQEKEHFQMPPEHGAHEGMTREQYVLQYREAYSRGYQHGSRI
jgi:hypothetical protein